MEEERKPLLRTNDTDVDTDSVDMVTNRRILLPTAGEVTWRHWLVWPACFLFMTAYNISFYTFGQYVYIYLQKVSFPNETINTTTSYCSQDTESMNYKIQVQVQQEAAEWGIYLYLAGGVTSIFANFILGSFTDRFGRKFLFILPCIGTLIRTGGVIAGIHYELPLYFYVFGLFIEGLTGQLFTLIQIGYIYVSDITPVGKKRSVGIVLIELAFGLGTSIPNLIVGYLLKYYSFIMPIVVSEVMLAVALCFMTSLPETYPKEIRAERKYSSAIENLKDATDLYFSKKNAGRRWMYIVVLLAFTLTTYDLFGRTSMEGLYVLNYPFCWAPEKMGIFGALRSGFQQIVGMGLVILFHLCMNDELIAIVGCISYAVSFVLEAFATSDLMMYLVTIVGTCGLLTIPMTRSILSQMTSPHKQGAVFASISVAETFINLLGAITANSIYIATVGFMRGFTFLLFAAFNVFSMLLLIIFTIGTRNSKLKYAYTD